MIPKIGTEVGKMIEVEARIDVIGRCNDIAPDVTTLDGRAGSVWKLPFGRECKDVFHKFSVAALVGALVDISHEGSVQVEDVLEIVEGHDRGG